MRFLYLRDPIFLSSVVAYLVNRFVLKRVWETGFVHTHLNDLLCIPMWVPLMLWGLRRVRLRPHDGPPELSEVVLPLIIWSWWFELMLPATALFGPWCVADHEDILYYALGALGAGIFWRWWYRAG